MSDIFDLRSLTSLLREAISLGSLAPPLEELTPSEESFVPLYLDGGFFEGGLARCRCASGSEGLMTSKSITWLLDVEKSVSRGDCAGGGSDVSFGFGSSFLILMGSGGGCGLTTSDGFVPNALHGAAGFGGIGFFGKDVEFVRVGGLFSFLFDIDPALVISGDDGFAAAGGGGLATVGGFGFAEGAGGLLNLGLVAGGPGGPGGPFALPSFF